MTLSIVSPQQFRVYVVQSVSVFVAAATVLVSSVALAEDLRIRIIDGDTLAIGATTYRLFGVDAPESRQTCTATSGVV